MVELHELPDIRDYAVGMINGQPDWKNGYAQHYYSALAAFWEARARLAVEALNEIKMAFENDCLIGCWGCCKIALEQIGELPDKR